MQQEILWSVGKNEGAIKAPIDAALELGAYEALWCEQNASFRSIAERLRSRPGSRPSNFIPEGEARRIANRVIDKLRRRTKRPFDIRIHGEWEYPWRLRDADAPIELLYFQGDWDLVSTPAVAIVGTRKPSDAGRRRAAYLTRKLVEDRFTIVSGLAEGIDTVAHETAIATGGRTIAVIGTPLGQVYPRSNADLQEKIIADHLLISQVPVERYDTQNFKYNRIFFPERNKLMSALTKATIIVEAGETSGTLVQAREALRQGRQLFIMNSCFERHDLTWPQRFEEQGAIRVHNYDEVRCKLVPDNSKNRGS